MINPNHTDSFILDPRKTNLSRLPQIFHLRTIDQSAHQIKLPQIDNLEIKVILKSQ